MWGPIDSSENFGSRSGWVIGMESHWSLRRESCDPSWVLAAFGWLLCLEATVGGQGQQQEGHYIIWVTDNDGLDQGSSS